jgi:hypothetical protein
MGKTQGAASLEAQANKIMEIAEHYGAQGNFMFVTTFKRYLVQINILNELEKVIEADGTLVTKEYVKGRENVYTHPAIGEYNKTTTAANNTAQTLIKILRELAADRDEEGDDPLLKIMAGEFGV